MSFVVRLAGYRPSPRDDEVAWNEIAIEESAAQGGPYVELERFDLDPLDADPLSPAVRSITTDQAALESGWYRVVFYDGGGNLQRATPVHSSGTSMPPSPNDVRQESRLLRKRYPVEPFDAEDERDLQRVVTTAVQLVEAITGRVLDGSLPERLLLIARRAVALKAEADDTATLAENAERDTSGRRLKSISAGPWAESYFGAGELGMKGNRPRLALSDPLDEALWLLATEERREELIAEATGRHPPAGAISQFGYGARSPRW